MTHPCYVCGVWGAANFLLGTRPTFHLQTVLFIGKQKCSSGPNTSKMLVASNECRWALANTTKCTLRSLHLLYFRENSATWNIMGAIRLVAFKLENPEDLSNRLSIIIAPTSIFIASKRWLGHLKRSVLLVQPLKSTECIHFGGNDYWNVCKEACQKI